MYFFSSKYVILISIMFLRVYGWANPPNNIIQTYSTFHGHHSLTLYEKQASTIIFRVSYSFKALTF